MPTATSALAEAVEPLLLLLEAPPYLDQHPQEGIELALTLAAFDQPLDLLAVGVGILQLLPGQQPQPLGARPLAPLLEMVQWYGLRQVFFEEEALALVGGVRLPLEGKTVPRRGLPELLRRYRLIVRA